MAESPAGVPGRAPGLVSELVTDLDQRLQLTYATLTVARRRFHRRPGTAQSRA